MIVRSDAPNEERITREEDRGNTDYLCPTYQSDGSKAMGYPEIIPWPQIGES